MTPQTAEFIAKARHLLGDADIMISARLNDAAARTAYLAGFHAAQAFIFERERRVFKTHHGVQTEFLRLTKDSASIAEPLRTFLSRTYNLKAIADYETGPGSEVSPDRACAAVSDAHEFVDFFAALLETPPWS